MVASPWLGGSGTVASRLVRILARNGHTVRLVTYPTVSSAQANAEVPASLVEPLEFPLFPFPLYELALAERIAEEVLSINAEIIHAHYGILFGHAAFLAQQSLRIRGYKVSVVLTLHGTDVLGLDLTRPGAVVPKYLNTLIIRSADAVSAVSNNLAMYAKDLYGANSTRIHVLHNAVNTKVFSPQPDIERSCENPILIHVSNFRPVKRPLLALDVFDLLRKKRAAQMWFVGEGPELSAVKEQVRIRAIPDVTFFGVLSERELVKKMARSQALILPSVYESFSLVALEAHATATPVVASRVGGIDEVVRHGETGYLIDPDAPASVYAAAVERVLSAPPHEYQRMSDAAWRHARKFDEEIITGQYLSLYQSVITKDSEETEKDPSNRWVSILNGMLRQTSD